MNAIFYNPTDFGSQIAKFRTSCIAAENAATPFARKALAGLLTGGATVSGVTGLLLAAFKPKLPSGKAGEKLSSLRNAPGGDAARKAAEKVFSIFADSALSPEILAIVSAFVLESDGAAKSLNACLLAVAVAVKAHNVAAAEAIAGADDAEPDAAGDAEPDAADAAGDAEPSQGDLSDMVNRLILAIDMADATAIDMLGERLEALTAAIGAAWQRLATATETPLDIAA